MFNCLLWSMWQLHGQDDIFIGSTTAKHMHDSCSPISQTKCEIKMESLKKFLQ